jgi:hypothetical protein
MFRPTQTIIRPLFQKLSKYGKNTREGPKISEIVKKYLNIRKSLKL